MTTSHDHPRARHDERGGGRHARDGEERSAWAHNVASLRERLAELCRGVVEPLGYDLVELHYKPGRRSWLRVFVDRRGGIGIEDCAHLSRVLGDALDAADPIPGRYELEVSSPGLDRPLHSERDFWRRVGEACRLTWRTAATVVPAEGARPSSSEPAGQPAPAPAATTESHGTILAAEGGVVRLATAAGELSIPLSQVVVGKLLY